MRWEHVLHNEHLPRMSLNDIRKLDSRAVVLFANLPGKVRGSRLVRKNHIEIDVAGATQVIALSLQSPKHVSIVIVRVNHSAPLPAIIV